MIIKNSTILFLSTRCIISLEDGTVVNIHTSKQQFNTETKVFEILSSTGMVYEGKKDANKLIINIFDLPIKVEQKYIEVGDNDELMKVVEQVTTEINRK